jgi:hypothetical protein
MENIKLVLMEEKEVEGITNIIRKALSEEDAEAAKKGYLHHFFWVQFLFYHVEAREYLKLKI